MADYNPKEVGQRIKTIRQNLGLSMSEFAKKIDKKAKSGTVSNWETGRNLPNNERIKKIAKLGQVSIAYLLEGIKDFSDFDEKDSAIFDDSDKNIDFVKETFQASYKNALYDYFYPKALSKYSFDEVSILYGIIGIFDLKKSFSDNEWAEIVESYRKVVSLSLFALSSYSKKDDFINDILVENKEVMENDLNSFRDTIQKYLDNIS